MPFASSPPLNRDEECRKGGRQERRIKCRRGSPASLASERSSESTRNVTQSADFLDSYIPGFLIKVLMSFDSRNIAGRKRDMQQGRVLISAPEPRPLKGEKGVASGVFRTVHNIAARVAKDESEPGRPRHGGRWGLGPVFAAECLTTSRRWQVYAGGRFWSAACSARLSSSGSPSWMGRASCPSRATRQRLSPALALSWSIRSWRSSWCSRSSSSRR